jgi:hypothetical protein
MNIKKLSIFVMCSILVLPVFISRADELRGPGKNPELRAQKEAERTQKLEQRELKTAEREARSSSPEGRLKNQACENISGTLSKRVSAMEASISKRKQVMSNIENAIQTRISKLKTDGKDVSTIEVSFASFKDKSDAYILEREAVLSKLKEVASLDCDTNRTALIQSIRNFNSAYKNHNGKNNELKEILRTTVLNPLKALQVKTTGVTSNE